MKNRKRALTESYRLNREGRVALSGIFEGIEGYGKALLEALCTEEVQASEELSAADIQFLPMEAGAEGLVRQVLKKEYVANEEGYVIDIDDTIKVYADTESAKLYAIMALRDLWEDGLDKAVIYGYPAVPYRSARVFLPSRKNMPYFRSFIDLLVNLGYNSLLLEIGGEMEYKKHPEINETWAAYCESMKEFNNKPYVASGVYCRTKNSVHTFNGEGDVYTQEELQELAVYCTQRGIEIIPEVPSLSPSESFLISHPELRECEDEPFASTACPCKEGLYNLVFDLYDEVIEVFHPKTLHIGHDEWWVMCVCDRCKNRDAAELFAYNVQRCYDYLKEKGIRTMMWADKLVRFYEKTGEEQGGAAKHVYHVKKDKTIEVLGEQYPLYARHWFAASEEAKETGFHQVIHDTAECMQMLPKDIICLNWYWATEPRILDDYLANDRIMNKPNSYMAGGAQGVSISNWIDSSEAGMQRWNTIFDLGYGAVICWNHDRREKDHAKNLRDTFDGLYRFRNRDILRGKHLEVVHTAVKAWEIGEAYYDDLPYAEEDKMTMGEYHVLYEDGSSDVFPIRYTLNIGTRDALTERWADARSWQYIVDKHLTTVAGVCNYEQREDGIWYRAVFPVKSEVKSVTYVPRTGLAEYVAVARMQIIEEKVC